MCDEQLKNDIIRKLYDKLSIDDIREVSIAIDISLAKYKVEVAETAIALRSAEGLELAKMYVASKAVEGQSKDGLRNRLYTIQSFFSDTMLPPSEVKANDIRLYLYNYKDAHNISDRSLDKMRQNINSFFQWAVEEGYLEKNPCSQIKKIKYEENQRKSLTPLELEKLRSCADDDLDRMMIEFLFATGCRIEEACSIKVSDIDFEKDEISVVGKGKKRRTVFLNAKAHLAVQKYVESRKQESEYLFCSRRYPYGRISTQAARNRINKISERAGIEITPHILRHTFATMMLQNGSPVTSVQKALGHSSINTTMIYAEVNDSQVKADHRRSVI